MCNLFYVNMRRIVYIVLVVAVLSSCDKELPSVPTEHFDEIVNVEPVKRVSLDNYDVFKPTKIVVYKDWYVFRDLAEPENQITCISKDFSKKTSCLNQGNGSLDVAGRFGIDADDDSIFVYNSNLKKILSLTCQGDTFVIVNSQNGWSPSSAAHFVSRCRYIEPSKIDTCMFKLVDNNGNSLSCAPYPKDENLMNLGHMKQNSIYLNTSYVHSPDGSHYAWGVTNTSVIGFGDIVGDSIMPRVEYTYSSLKIGTIKKFDVDRVVPDRENIVNVISGASSEKYAIFLYSGAKYADKNQTGHNLLVYKWDGTPYVRITCKENLISICYDESNGYILAIAYEPDPLLVFYNVRKVLK